MPKLSTLPYAAVGVAAKTARTVSTCFESARKDLRSAAGEFISQSADEGRRVAARMPHGTRLMRATSVASRPVTDILGLDATTATKLNGVGVHTVADMWTHAGDRSGRAALAGSTGIDANRLAAWARQADLMRVRTIGPRYAALLELAGVTSLKQLRRRNAEALHETLESTNRTAKVVESVPVADEISDWIESAGVISA